MARWDSFVPGGYAQCHRKPKVVYCAPYGCLYLTWLAFFLGAYGHITGIEAKFGDFKASRAVVCGYSAIYTGQEWRYWPQGHLGATWGHQEGRGGLFADRQGSFRAKNTPFRAFYRVFRKIGLENRLLQKK